MTSKKPTLGMLVLNLVSMFRGHTKLAIGTKINIVRGFILKMGVTTTPSLVVSVTKKQKTKTKKTKNKKTKQKKPW